MHGERALFLTRQALESGRTAAGLSARLTGMLRDYAARGYVILVVTDELRLGDETFTTARLMLQAIRNVERHVLPVADVLLLQSSFDPRPFWDAARRFNVSLAASTYVTQAGELGGAARTAGVDRIEASAEVFGLAA